MKGATIDFGPSILAHAKAGNRVLSQEEVTSLGETLNSLAEIQAGDQPALTFGLGGDKRGDLNAALDLYGIGYGQSVGAEIGRTTTTPTPGSKTATERAIELNRAAKAGSSEIKQRQAETLARTFGNPWRTGNATHRAFITNTHPTLASRLRREAGERA